MTPAYCAALVRGLFPALGVNKNREVSRLLFEIAKRERLTPESVLAGTEKYPFEQLKKFLIRRRYPSCKKPAAARLYLPAFAEPAPASPCGEFKPLEIYCEKSADESAAFQNAVRLFASAKVTLIDSLKTFVADGGAKDFKYNDRGRRLFVARELFDFIKPCPCTTGAACCGYSVLNTGFGCVYDCHYCFLQQYQNFSAILLPCNIDDFLKKAAACPMPKGFFSRPRLGSGEFTDSLVFDHVSGYSKAISEFMERGADFDFEFKTKSLNIGGLMALKPQKDIVVSWSVNPDEVIASAESGTPPLAKRLDAASACAAHGYRIGFHFDPMIYCDGWEEKYRLTVERLASAVPPEKVAWISVGTIRFNPALKKDIESRFPQNTILDGELLTDFDGKMRYPEHLRVAMYRKMYGFLKKHFGASALYLCMESLPVWEKSGWPLP